MIAVREGAMPVGEIEAEERKRLRGYKKFSTEKEYRYGKGKI